MLARVACADVGREERPLSNRYVHRRAAGGSVDDHADWSWDDARDWGDGESLGDAGDDQGEFHLGEREADAVAGAAAERHPRNVGEGCLVVGRRQESIRVEPEGLVPGSWV